MGLIFFMFVHIAIRNNHTKFRLNWKHSDIFYIFSGESETSPLRGLEFETSSLKTNIIKI